MKQLLLIDHEFGAGASTIGGKIAQKLGWNCFDQALTQEIARLPGFRLILACGVWNAMIRSSKTLVNVIWRAVLTVACHRPIWRF